MNLNLSEILKKLSNFKIKKDKNRVIVTAIRGCKKETALPRVLTSDICYLVGVIIGDGCISLERNKKRGTRYRITIDSTSNEILKMMQRILRDKFRLKTKIKDRKRASRIELKSTPLAFYLNIIFEIPVGKKSFKTKIPEVIKKDRKLTYSFLSGLIDTDFGRYGRTMGMSARSKKLVNDLKEFFDKENIRYKTKIYKVRELPAYHIWLDRKSIPKLINKVETQFMLQNKERRNNLISRGAGAWKTGRRDLILRS